MELGLDGRRAIVAASTAGLGFGVARALAAEGARVAICGRDEARLAAAAGSLPEGTVALSADVSTPSGATEFVTEATEALGGVDVLVPNAGGPPPGGFSDTPPDRFPDALGANLLATVAMCYTAVPTMMDVGWGRVVAITSATVREPAPEMILSNTARAGVTGFLKTLAGELAASGVTVNSVQPGSHRTARMVELAGDDVEEAAARVPVGRLGDPEDFGAVVAFLCSEAAGFITGAAVPVDGGASHGLQ